MFFWVGFTYIVTTNNFFLLAILDKIGRIKVVIDILGITHQLFSDILSEITILFSHYYSVTVQGVLGEQPIRWKDNEHVGWGRVYDHRNFCRK